jgi:hypothetical protein
MRFLRSRQLTEHLQLAERTNPNPNPNPNPRLEALWTLAPRLLHDRAGAPPPTTPQKADFANRKCIHLLTSCQHLRYFHSSPFYISTNTIARTVETPMNEPRDRFIIQYHNNHMRLCRRSIRFIKSLVQQSACICGSIPNSKLTTNIYHDYNSLTTHTPAILS